MGKFFKKLKALLLNLLKFSKSKSRLKNFHSIESFTNTNIRIRSYNYADEVSVKKLYKELNGIDLSIYHRELYKREGDKLLFISIDKNKIVGMDMFYFNSRDFKENTIHEGFIGVLPESEGQGIATEMRQEAIKHFQKNGLSGISTRISKNNLGSLRSAKKLGFKPVEEYYDEQMKEKRYYLINWFNS